MVRFYSQHGNPEEALEHYKRMIDVGFLPNLVTVVSVLQACALSADLQEGRKVHEYAIHEGFELDVAVATALIDMYMKCSCVKEAEDLFCRMPRKDVVAWAALINGYTRNGLPDQSLVVFHRMLFIGTRADAVTMVKVLAACSQLGIIRQALCFHGFSVRGGFDHKGFVGAALVDMYSKCGHLEAAIRVFETMGEKDVVLWSSMIAGFGFHGFGRNAILAFEQMVESSFKPNDITFVSLLSACSHSGLIEDGKKIFNEMECTYGVSPVMEHYSVMVDLLGRAGELDGALKLIKLMPNPAGPHIWSALLTGCRTHGNIEMIGLAARNLFALAPDHAGYYLSMINAFDSSGKWDNITKVRGLVKDHGLTKTPGHSLIEVGSGIHTFLADERSHLELESIYHVLRSLEVMMREEGYASGVNALRPVMGKACD